MQFGRSEIDMAANQSQNDDIKCGLIKHEYFLAI